MTTLGFIFSKTWGSTKKGDVGFGSQGIPCSTAGQGMTKEEPGRPQSMRSKESDTTAISLLGLQQTYQTFTY